MATVIAVVLSHVCDFPGSYHVLTLVGNILHE